MNFCQEIHIFLRFILSCTVQKLVSRGLNVKKGGLRRPS